MKRLIALLTLCFVSQTFSLTINELLAIDSAKAAAMKATDLFSAKDAIKQQIKRIAIDARKSQNNIQYIQYSNEDVAQIDSLNRITAILDKRIESYFSMEELTTLDQSKVAVMPRPDLAAAKECIPVQIRKIERNAYGTDSMGADDRERLQKLYSGRELVQNRIDYYFYREYNAFDHLSSFHEYSGAFNLIVGIGGFAFTFLEPITNTKVFKTNYYGQVTSTSKTTYDWGWWMLPSAVLSIIEIHLGATEIKLGKDLGHYSAIAEIPVK